MSENGDRDELGRFVVGRQPMNDAEPGNSRALKHGVKAVYANLPRAKKIAESLWEVAPWLTEADRVLVDRLALWMAQSERGHRRLAEFASPAEAPVRFLQDVRAIDESIRRLCERLGLDPSARAKLGVDRVRGATLVEHLQRRYSEKAER